MEIIRVPEKLEHVGKEPFLPHGKSCSSSGFLCGEVCLSARTGSRRQEQKAVFLNVSLLSSVGK